MISNVTNQFVLLVFISIFILYVSIYWNNVIWKEGIYFKEPSGKIADSKTLFIGITSGIDHFRERQSLRETWLTLLPNTFQYRFVVGEEACKIHPLDRKSLYTCERLEFLIPENTSDETIFYANPASVPGSTDCDNEDNIGFSFHVHYPIVVRALGIKRKNNILKRKMMAKVVLTDARTSEIITSVTVGIETLQNDSTGGDYIFKKVKDPVILPKGFEGAVKVKGLFENIQEASLKNHDSLEWTHGNFVTILSAVTRNVNQTSNHYCPLSTFNFSLKDLDALRSHIQGRQHRQSEWSQHITEVKYRLQQEVDLNKDILLLNMVDVYRNLPKKVLFLFKWVHDSLKVDYVLKTDDDTFIDINRVKLELDGSSGWGWWSCFRVGWLVQRYGKWREDTFQGQVYPPFPSGAGYVLSNHVLVSLLNRVDNISTDYQGEDVSVGIWLEGMNMTRHVGSECYWACNRQCHSQTCNAMELSVEDVYKMWADFQECGNKICRCPYPS